MRGVFQYRNDSCRITAFAFLDADGAMIAFVIPAATFRASLGIRRRDAAGCARKSGLCLARLWFRSFAHPVVV
jgi:hypothetical protein